jgi:predicted HicB family RNase H-like nuclease
LALTEINFGLFFALGMRKKKKTHGGRREGAGRRPKNGKTALVGVRMTHELRAQLKVAAHARGASVSEFVEELIREKLAS